jgi:histone H3/H4
MRGMISRLYSYLLCTVLCVGPSVSAYALAPKSVVKELAGTLTASGELASADVSTVPDPAPVLKHLDNLLQLLGFVNSGRMRQEDLGDLVEGSFLTFYESQQGSGFALKYPSTCPDEFLPWYDLIHQAIKATPNFVQQGGSYHKDLAFNLSRLRQALVEAYDIHLLEISPPEGGEKMSIYQRWHRFFEGPYSDFVQASLDYQVEPYFEEALLTAARRLNPLMVPTLKRFTQLIRRALANQVSFADLQRENRNLAREWNSYLEPVGFHAISIASSVADGSGVMAIFRIDEVLYRREYRIHHPSTGEIFESPILFMRPLMDLPGPGLAPSLYNIETGTVSIDISVIEDMTEQALLALLDADQPLVSPNWIRREGMHPETLNVLLSEFSHLLPQDDINFLRLMATKFQAPVEEIGYLIADEPRFYRILRDVLARLRVVDAAMREGTLGELTERLGEQVLNDARTYAQSEGGRQTVRRMKEELLARLMRQGKGFSVNLSQPFDAAQISQLEEIYAKHLGPDGLQEFKERLQRANDLWLQGYSDEEHDAFRRVLDYVARQAAEVEGGIAFFQVYLTRSLDAYAQIQAMRGAVLRVVADVAGTAYFSRIPKADALPWLLEALVPVSAGDTFPEGRFALYASAAFPQMSGISPPIVPADLLPLFQSVLALDEDGLRATLQAALNDPSLPEAMRIAPGEITVAVADEIAITPSEPVPAADLTSYSL